LLRSKFTASAIHINFHSLKYHLHLQSIIIKMLPTLIVCVLSLAPLADAKQIETILFVSHLPRA